MPARTPMSDPRQRASRRMKIVNAKLAKLESIGALLELLDDDSAQGFGEMDQVNKWP